MDRHARRHKQSGHHTRLLAQPGLCFIRPPEAFQRIITPKSWSEDAGSSQYITKSRTRSRLRRGSLTGRLSPKLGLTVPRRGSAEFSENRQELLDVSFCLVLFLALAAARAKKHIQKQPKRTKKSQMLVFLAVRRRPGRRRGLKTKSVRNLLARLLGRPRRFIRPPGDFQRIITPKSCYFVFGVLFGLCPLLFFGRPRAITPEINRKSLAGLAG